MADWWVGESHVTCRGCYQWRMALGESLLSPHLAGAAAAAGLTLL